MGIDLKTLGERLDRARKNCGYTQQQAADAVGLPRTAIVHIEAGNRSINTVELAALAEFYKVPVAYFFEQSTPEQPSALVALCRVSAEFASDPAVNQEISRYVDICGGGHVAPGDPRQEGRSIRTDVRPARAIQTMRKPSSRGSS
jgi:transcriptional regulator with XRE-family HTH domain